ncbi:hypothetical protein [Phaeodactylibacter xiamenensis]|uniref:hypothetical protein n=1 Tax=Phaeodactylibacter xiamenensis TaxID=1524460 RepID=UPI0024A94DF6|nr:hypothetical protein [Phaeodactylibacter xiamenensis]
MTNIKASEINPGVAKTLFTLFRDNPHCDIAEVPLLRQLLLAHAPELLRHTNEAQLLRNRIRAYLFEQPQLKDTGLQRAVPQDLFDGLYVLKKMLRDFNWVIVEESMRQKKMVFGLWLDNILKEEEEE